MRAIDDAAIKAAAEQRFRSERHYAQFEYLRSAKVIQALERAGVKVGGRVLDAGCGSGGTALSLAEESLSAVGLDLDARFRGSGTSLARREGHRQRRLRAGRRARAAVPRRSFDLVFSHSVIEHVASARDYLAECRRVLKPGGVLYLSTAPYLSLAGAHLPRLLLPLPLHIPLGRHRAFQVFVWLARHAPWALQEQREANTFIQQAEQGLEKRDDLLERDGGEHRGSASACCAGSTGSGLRAAALLQDRHVTGLDDGATLP